MNGTKEYLEKRIEKIKEDNKKYNPNSKTEYRIVNDEIYGMYIELVPYSERN